MSLFLALMVTLFGLTSWTVAMRESEPFADPPGWDRSHGFHRDQCHGFGRSIVKALQGVIAVALVSVMAKVSNKDNATI